MKADGGREDSQRKRLTVGDLQLDVRVGRVTIGIDGDGEFTMEAADIVVRGRGKTAEGAGATTDRTNRSKTTTQPRPSLVDRPSEGQREQPDIRDIVLRFSVSNDEERVWLRLGTKSGELDLGVRSHHYLLLTLARLRVRDTTDSSLTSDERGWVDADGLARMLGIDRNHLGVSLHRAKRQFAASGITRSAALFERRPVSGTLRLGIERFEFERMG